jgi:hypothetical protein
VQSVPFQSEVLTTGGWQKMRLPSLSKCAPSVRPPPMCATAAECSCGSADGPSSVACSTVPLRSNRYRLPSGATAIDSAPAQNWLGKLGGRSGSCMLQMVTKTEACALQSLPHDVPEPFTWPSNTRTASARRLFGLYTPCESMAAAVGACG